LSILHQGRADSSANWTAVPMNGGPSFAVGSVGYIQTATNTAEKWEQGEKTFTYYSLESARPKAQPSLNLNST
jgi:hypothetical protein